MKPGKYQSSKQRCKIYVGRSATVHNLLFCAHTLCMSYVTNTFLLASASVRSKQLLFFVHGQGQKSEQKHITKNFARFHNHSTLLTMVWYILIVKIPMRSGNNEQSLFLGCALDLLAIL